MSSPQQGPVASSNPLMAKLQQFATTYAQMLANDTNPDKATTLKNMHIRVVLLLLLLLLVRTYSTCS